MDGFWRPLFGVLVLSGVLAAGCSTGKKANSAADLDAGRTGSERDPKTSDPGGKALIASALATVPAGTFGPYVGQRDAGALSVWAANGEAGTRRWYAARIDDARRVATPAIDLGPAPSALGVVAVRPTGPRDAAQGLPANAGRGPAYAIVSTHAESEDHAIELMLVDSNAKLVSGPTRLALVPASPLWVDALPTTSGTLIFWAVARSGRAAIYAHALDAAGQKLGEPILLAEQALSWQVTAASGGAALGIVKSKNTGSTGRVELVLTDARGKLLTRSAVSGDETANADLDLVRLGSSLVFAWSDAQGLEARVKVALVDRDGKLKKQAFYPAPPFGEQAVVRLVAQRNESAGAYLIWENLVERTEDARVLRVARLDEQGVLSEAQGRIETSPSETLGEIAASSDGLAALLRAPICASGGTCVPETTAWTYLELGPDFSPLASEPLRLSALDGKLADLAWGLTCSRAGCFALAAPAKAPAPVYLVSLEARGRSYRAPGGPARAGKPPRVVALQALAEGPPASQLDSIALADGVLSVWLSDFDESLPYERPSKPAPDGRYAPVRALLQARAARDAGQTLLPTEVLSYRARSSGGFALSADPGDRASALVAWTAIDNGRPQVFLTLVDSQGRRQKQRMFTNVNGVVGDPALVALDDGWLLGWVDERDGHPHIYAAKVDRALNQVGKEQRVTSAEGSPTGLRLWRRGESVLILWSDARQHRDSGFADIFVAELHEKDGSRVAPERVLFESAAHSHSVVLAGAADRAVVAWLEETLEGSARAVALVGELAGLELSAAPSELTFEGGVPTALALSCGARRCRLAASVDASFRGQLEVMVLGRSASASPAALAGPRVLVGLSGPAGQASALALLESELYYLDRRREQGLLHRMLIEWQ